MIKAILFDFDGVLASLKQVHYESLNKALKLVDEKYVISIENHVSTFDGLSTRKKLEILSETKGLPNNLHQQIFDDKQKYTLEVIESNLDYDNCLIEILSKLKINYKLYLASNAIRKTIIKGLTKLGVLEYFDKIISNEDVKNQKPSPEIYLKCMVEAGIAPSETLIIEDSKHGRESAIRSEAYVCGVDNPSDVTYKKITEFIENIKPKPIRWAGKPSTTVLIPMAGAGSRFAQAGYTRPKPLIDINGKPMIQKVVENLNVDANFIFIVQKTHYEQYNLDILLPLIVPGCKILQTEGLTEGAACTSLLAKEYINNDNHLMIANSDQYLVWDSCDFMYNSISNNLDGNIVVFKDTNPKWSFAKTNDEGFVIEGAEKKPDKR